MINGCRDSEPMCETSELGERLISPDEILPISLDVGRRVLEVFGYQRISNIVFRLKSTSREINAVVNGESLPSPEILIGIRKTTGASIDWILTGEGRKFARQTGIADQSSQNLSLAVLAARRERKPQNNLAVYMQYQFYREE